MTRRLLLSYLGLALVILLILELPLAALAQRFEEQLATAQAQKEVSGLVALSTDDIEENNLAALQQVVSGYRDRTGGEVTVLSPSGSVLVSSSQDRDNDAEEWSRVTSHALAGQPASAYLSDEGQPYAVAATPVGVDGRSLGVLVLGSTASLTEHRIHEIWLFLGLFAAAAMVVAAVGGVFMARSFAHPLGRLQLAVDRLGRGQLTSRASELAGPPEVRALAGQFNHMAAQIDELVDAQRRFVADASHQLRSPLTALRLRIENLQAVLHADAVDSVAAIGREVHRLSRLVDGLLALSQAEQGAEAAPLRVAGVIADRVEAWDALASERQVHIVADLDGAGEVVWRLHPGDLDQILDNLLANAVEVSEEGSRIAVALRPGVGGAVEMHVTDQGPGMSETERSRAFDRFWQGSERRSGHSGLGLAIVKQLATRNGLAVELRDAPPRGLDAVITATTPQVPVAR